MAKGNKAKLSANAAQEKIREILIDAGVNVNLAGIRAEEAVNLRDRIKMKTDTLEAKIQEEAEDAESYIDVLHAILMYTPTCPKFGLDAPMDFFDDLGFEHDFLADFQYCCSALATPIKKRLHCRIQDENNEVLNSDYTPVNEFNFSKEFNALVNEHINDAVIERFCQIYREVFGPNGLDIKGKQYDKIVKMYGVDPLNR
ncbi:MAG: hypothetical protein WC455_26720 [Dehalococcoidia bacterium]